jgi:hypothetical protein
MNALGETHLPQDRPSEVHVERTMDSLSVRWPAPSKSSRQIQIGARFFCGVACLACSVWVFSRMALPVPHLMFILAGVFVCTYGCGWLLIASADLWGCSDGATCQRR